MHSALTLTNGRVLFGEGNALGRDGAGTLTNTAEIYKLWSFVTGQPYRRGCCYSWPTA